MHVYSKRCWHCRRQGWKLPWSEWQVRFYRDLLAGCYDEMLLEAARQADRDCCKMVKDHAAEAP
jgi:hypothetical protein